MFRCPVIPEILRAKVRVFADLYRKTRLLERLNNELEQRVVERTAELTAALERQAILAREVDHRAKNALAVVQSILHLTRADDVRGYVASVEGRIHALSRAHDLLSQSRWEGANLSRLIEEELEPYQHAGRRPDRRTRSSRGASAGGGADVGAGAARACDERREVRRAVCPRRPGEGRVGPEPKRPLSLTWAESGGPAVARPAAQGFGTKLIRLSMQGQLNGKVDFDWRPSGLFCQIAIARDLHTAPLADNRSDEGSADSIKRTNGEEHARRRVLVVEDEALVAMMMVGFVEELGFTPCGPFASVNEAAAAVRNGRCDGALLDVNLGGELVYPVADLLSARGVPFVFVTGYNSELVDKRFTNIPILQKPVQIVDLEQAFVEWGFLAGDQPGPLSRQPQHRDRPTNS